MTPALILAASLWSVIATCPARSDARRLAPLIVREAARAGIAPELAAAVAAHESGCRMSARGRLGEVGAYQLYPGRSAAGSVPVERLAIASVNVRLGVRHLARVRAVCGGEPVRWLSVYSGRKCGPSRYSKAIVEAAQASGAWSAALTAGGWGT